MTIITVDALDAAELAKIFEFVFGSLDTLVGPATVVASWDGDAYHLDDLRGDIARLAHRLTSSLTPDATPTPITVEVDRGSASSWGRPLERSWLIRLRRADAPTSRLSSPSDSAGQGPNILLPTSPTSSLQPREMQQ
jgi:hypothetical protein